MNKIFSHIALKSLVFYGLGVLGFLAIGTLFPTSITHTDELIKNYKLWIVLVLFVISIINQTKMQKRLAVLTVFKDDFENEIKSPGFLKAVPIIILSLFFNCNYLGYKLFTWFAVLNFIVLVIGYLLTFKIKRYKFLQEIKDRGWSFKEDDISQIMDVIKGMTQEEFVYFSRYIFILSKAMKTSQRDKLIHEIKELYKAKEFKGHQDKAKELAVFLAIAMFDKAQDFIKEGFVTEDINRKITYRSLVIYYDDIKDELEPLEIRKIMNHLNDQPGFQSYKKDLEKSDENLLKNSLLTLELIASSADTPKTPKKVNKI